MKNYRLRIIIVNKFVKNIRLELRIIKKTYFYCLIDILKKNYIL
jgi:hypothetical protein